MALPVLPRTVASLWSKQGLQKLCKVRETGEDLCMARGRPCFYKATGKEITKPGKVPVIYDD